MASHLEVLKNIFLELEIEAILAPSDEDTPYERLYLHLNHEEAEQNEEEPLLAVLVLLNEVMGIEKSENDEKVEILQISILISLELNEDNKFTTSYLLSKINKNIPLGQFCLTDEDVIFYKYSILSQMNDSEDPTAYFDPVVILDSLGFISEIVFGIKPLLEQYLQGKLPMNEVLSSIV